MPKPSVTGISPSSGPTTGGTLVTITGSNFAAATGVAFGPFPASFPIGSDTQIVAAAPPMGAGTVDVRVSNNDGISDPVLADQFLYTSVLPVVTSIFPTSGPTSGGTTVTVRGQNFTGATGVSLGGFPVPTTVDSDMQIRVTTSAGLPGTVDVLVSTPSGTSTPCLADQFLYTASVPTVTRVSPAFGPTSGGTSVLIGGTNFTGATGVAFGDAVAHFTVDSATQITATAPVNDPGTVDILVTNADGTSAPVAADRFLYQAAIPTITSMTVNSGPTSGGTQVVIRGTNFQGVMGVAFGDMAAGFTVNSDTQITAVSPAHEAGTVDVEVTNMDGTSVPVLADQFLYVPAVPVITGLMPNSGPAAGGTIVNIMGTNFTGVTGVAFGGNAANFMAMSATQITALTPPHAPGQVAVLVTNGDGTSVAAQFTYTAAIPDPACQA